MTNELDPILGNWYRHLDKGQTFMVVAVDDKERIVELQHFDGDIEEIELENWYAMELELSDAPEDWSGPVDNIEHDDTGYTETEMTSGDLREPLEENPRSPTELWEDASAEDERDDWAEGTAAEEPVQQQFVENTKLASVPGEEERVGEEPEAER